jgi:uncharacterized protein (TIGR00304 family)
MQIGNEYQIVGILLIFVGILIIIIGVIYLFGSSNLKQTSTKESKGVILLGPIPIVWGFGKKTKIITIILFLIFITIWIILFFL